VLVALLIKKEEVLFFIAFVVVLNRFKRGSLFQVRVQPPEPVNVPTASSNSVHKHVLLGEVVVKARTIPKG
ncbi:hypothetical protein Tco_1330509, partial [Tanacetum coccineum]